MIIGITGWISSGKGTVGSILQEQYNFKKESFAKPLKDMVSLLFDWDREMLEGETEEGRKTRELVDEKWTEFFKTKSSIYKLFGNYKGNEISPRYALQMFGEGFRNYIHRDFWIKKLNDRLSPVENYVITDVRYRNEINYIKDSGGFIIEIRRELDVPDWYNTIYKINKERFDTKSITRSIDEIAPEGLHVTEYEWIGYGRDALIINDSTKENLDNKVGEVLNLLPQLDAMQKGVENIKKALYNGE